MKRLSILLLALALAVPIFAGDNKNNTPDLNGLPDLIVSSNLGQQWVVRVEDLPASFCSVEEGGVTPGTHTILRMTVMTPNIGTADNFVGNPREHMGPPAPDGSYPQSDGLFEFATCHNHFHFRHYALYELID